MKKILSVVLAAACVMGLLAGCGEVAANIADNVLEAAKEELVAQLQTTLEEYKVEVAEIKPLVGKLNDEGGTYQFFCAALVKTNSQDSAAACADALGKVFTEAGFAAQTGKALENEHLVHKTIEYKTEDYSEGTYYTVYVYTPDLTKLVDLEAIKNEIQKAADSLTEG